MGYEFSPDNTRTLARTDIDGGLNVDANGNFFADKEVLRFFNYMLQAKGEVSQLQIDATIRQYIADSLKPPADQQALAFYQQFLNFRSLARDYYQINGQPTELADSLALLNQLREQAFGPEISKQLFGEQQLLEQQRLQRVSIVADHTLSNEEKQQLDKPRKISWQVLCRHNSSINYLIFQS